MKKNILILLALSSLFACKQKKSTQTNGDKFYTEKSDLGWIRIPLIKPYQAVSSSSGQWNIQTSSDTAGLDGTVSGAMDINVIDSVILVHGRKTIIKGQPVNEGWFILIPKNQVFQEFETHQQYINYTSSINIKDPKLYAADQILQYFNKNDTVNWKEINRLY